MENKLPIIKAAIFSALLISFLVSLYVFNQPLSKNKEIRSALVGKCGWTTFGEDMRQIPSVYFKMKGFIIPVKIVNSDMFLTDVNLSIPSEYLFFSGCENKINISGEKEKIIEIITKKGLNNARIIAVLPNLTPSNADFAYLGVAKGAPEDLISIDISGNNKKAKELPFFKEDKETTLQKHLQKVIPRKSQKLLYNLEPVKLEDGFEIYTQAPDTTAYIGYVAPKIFVQRNARQEIIRLFQCMGNGYEEDHGGRYNGICRHEFLHKEGRVSINVEFYDTYATDIENLETKIKNLIDRFEIKVNE